MKNERGITLLSLIITLVVMLILAGVTIYSSLYENSGVINEVKDETLKQQEMVKNEKNKMNTVLQEVEEEWGIGPNA